MSATLDAGPVRAFLGGCPALRSEGGLFELAVSYTPYSAAPLEEQVAGAVERVCMGEGDVLVFLPGAAEIRRAARACEALARRQDWLVTPLYGDLSPAEQDLAVEPAPQRKGDFVNQYRGEFDHDRGCAGGGGFGAGAHCERFAMDRTAVAGGEADQQGVGEAAGGASRADGAWAGDPAVYGGGFSPAARSMMNRRFCGGSCRRCVCNWRRRGFAIRWSWSG